MSRGRRHQRRDHLGRRRGAWVGWREREDRGLVSIPLPRQPCNSIRLGPPSEGPLVWLWLGCVATSSLDWALAWLGLCQIFTGSESALIRTNTSEWRSSFVTEGFTRA